MPKAPDGAGLARAIAIALALVGTLSGCALMLIFPVSINYRVDAKISVQGKEVSSSAVWSLTLTEVQVGGPGKRFQYEVRGEALRFVVPGEPDMYLLRRGRADLPTLAYGALPRACFDAKTREEEIEAIRQFQGPCRTREVPMLVTFGDPADVTTLRTVDYQAVERGEKCEQVCLLSLTATRTSDRVSVGLVKNLPWLSMGELGSKIGTGEKRRGMIGGDLDTLYNLDFSTEVGWRN